MGSSEVFSELANTTDLLWYVTAFQLAVYILYQSYYPLTRKVIFTYFASPATYGVLTSERFATLQW